MTAPPQHPAARLREALEAEVAKIGEFITLLESEHDLLKQGKTEALIPLIEDKDRLVNALAILAQAREADLSRLGLPAGRTGMEAWVAHCGGGDLHQVWAGLMELASKARELNVLNGKLIGLHMNHNQQAFGVLMSAADRAMTYGPDGQQHTGLGGRILGTA